jgi:hypothetical protein
MNCRGYRPAIVELARGGDMPAALYDGVRSHLDRCAACRAELRRQEQLSANLRALAEEAGQWTAAVNLEARLNEAFAAAAHSSAPAETYKARAGSRWWTAAAAALVFLVSWLAMVRTRPAPGPFEEARHQTPAPAGISAPKPPSVAAPPRTSARAATPAARENKAARPQPARMLPPVRTVEFMEIPGASGLPALESATIVRTELPVSALPTYGVDITPNSGRSAIEADLLIGQDGQARGIRLITTAQESGESRSRR